MERLFQLATDSGCDLPQTYFKEHDIAVMHLSYTMDCTQSLTDDHDPEAIKKLYKFIREGGLPKTSQVNPDAARIFMEPFAQAGTPFVCLSFSSALSGTWNSCRLAMEDLKQEYPAWNALLLDTKCASLGQGLLTDYAVRLRDAGKTPEDAYADLCETAPRLCHFFTVDDLGYLNRGGRISKITMILGTLINIKPVLHVNDAGQLINIGKVRGRRQALDRLADKMVEHMDRARCDRFFISHGDCEEDALYLRDRVTEKTGISEYFIENVGPVIGSHSGPGTVALFFIGNNRNP